MFFVILKFFGSSLFRRGIRKCKDRLPVKLNELTITEAHRLLKSREISSVELIRAVLERIQAVDDRVDAFITITEKEALQYEG